MRYTFLWYHSCLPAVVENTTNEVYVEIHPFVKLRQLLFVA